MQSGGNWYTEETFGIVCQDGQVDGTHLSRAAASVSSGQARSGEAEGLCHGAQIPEHGTAFTRTRSAQMPAGAVHAEAADSRLHCLPSTSLSPLSCSFVLNFLLRRGSQGAMRRPCSPLQKTSDREWHVQRQRSLLLDKALGSQQDSSLLRNLRLLA